MTDQVLDALPLDGLFGLLRAVVIFGFIGAVVCLAVWLGICAVLRRKFG